MLNGHLIGRPRLTSTKNDSNKTIHSDFTERKFVTGENRFLWTETCKSLLSVKFLLIAYIAVSVSRQNITRSNRAKFALLKNSLNSNICSINQLVVRSGPGSYLTAASFDCPFRLYRWRYNSCATVHVTVCEENRYQSI